jgi:hypothetical protein
MSDSSPHDRTSPNAAEPNLTPENQEQSAPQQIHVNISVNLTAALAKFLVVIQRLVDLVSVGITGVRKVEESEYNSGPFRSSVRFADSRIPFSEIKTEFDAWSLKNGFTDAVDYLSVLLEECRLVASLSSLGSNITGAELNRARFEERESFHWMGTRRQIEFLRERYNISSPLEEHVLSLIKIRNCFVHRHGIVGNEDLDDSGRMMIKWYAFHMMISDTVTGTETLVDQQSGPTQNPSNLRLRVGLVERCLSIGDRIQLSPTEFFDTMHTFYRFALELLQVVERRLQPGNG